MISTWGDAWKPYHRLTQALWVKLSQWNCSEAVNVCASMKLEVFLDWEYSPCSIPVHTRMLILFQIYVCSLYLQYKPQVFCLCSKDTNVPEHKLASHPSRWAYLYPSNHQFLYHIWMTVWQRTTDRPFFKSLITYT